MAARIRAFDWSKTPIGPMDTWPQSLRTAVSICLGSRFPMMLWWGPDLTNIYNDAFVSVLGGWHPRALGMSGREVWTDTWPVIGSQVAKVMEEGGSTLNERVRLVYTRHGFPEETWFTWSFGPIYDESGSVGGLFNTCHEDTAAVRAEREREQLFGELQIQRSRLADVIEQSPAFICTLRGPDHIFEIANERYYEIAGRRDVIGKTVREVQPEVEGQGYLDILDRVYRTGEPFEAKEKSLLLRRGGDGPLEQRFINVAWQALREADGTVSGVFIHGVDVTDLVRSREALRASEERYRQLVETAHEGIWTIDADGRTTYVNQRMAELLGYAPEEMMGRVHTDFMWEEDRPKGDLEMERRRQGDAEVWDQRYRRKDGSELWTVASCSTLHDAAGKFAGALGMFTDITRRKRAEAERQALLDRERAARAEAEKANEAKDRFLAVLSHELRTPLSPVVMTIAELEQHPALPDDVRESMSMVRRNIDLETRLIDDLLDLSRVTSGKLRLRMEQTNLHDILRHAYEVSASDVNAKRLNIKFDFGATNDRVTGDRSRLQQVFWNLMKNAIKFSPEGRDITVRTSDAGPGRVRVDVADNGIGITPQALPHIFGAFDQGDSRTAHQFGGLGLGLAISRAIMDMHGGTITATSGGVGRGATFTVEMDTTASALPVATSEESSPAARADGEPRRILLVEDHPDTARVMGRLLGQSGYLVSVAHSVASALKFAAAGPFDLVISDIGLPDATGYDLMRQLKTLYAIKGIALSGYGMEDDLRRGREAGFDDHVTKPVNLPQLQAAIERVLGRNGSPNH